jgi:hypothetical protein
VTDLIAPAGIYLGASGADLLSTEYAREFGAGEVNTLGQQYSGRLAVKGGLVVLQVGADVFLQHAERRTHLVLTTDGRLERRKTTTAKAAAILKWVARGGGRSVLRIQDDSQRPGRRPTAEDALTLLWLSLIAALCGWVGEMCRQASKKGVKG